MKGTVTPRPAKYVLRRGKLMPAPLRPYEEWTDPKTGKTVRAGANGSTWTWKFTTGSAKAGTRRHDSKGGFATKAACEASLAEALSAVAKGDTRPLMKPDAIAIGDYLRNWLDARGDLKPSTRSGYSDAVAHWIAPRHENGRYVPAPRLGEVLLSDLRPEQLTEFFGALRSHGGQITKGERETAEAEGRKPVGRPLGPRRVRLAYTIVHMALADAVETGKLPFNPVERVPRRQRPSHNPAKQADQHWSPLQAGIFLADRRTDRLEVLWRFAIGTGARRGEILGLHWSDVDLARAKVTIRTSRVLLGGTVLEGTTKSSRLRVVDLGPRAVDALRMWKKLQGKERERAGSSWLGGDPGRNGHVFTNEVGEPLDPAWISREFLRAHTGLDVPRTSFHGLRHTSATVALSKGVPVHLVSERLGHSKVSITQDVYAHVIPTHGADAARIIEDEIEAADEDSADEPEEEDK